MISIEDKSFLTQKEVAEYLRVSVGTVINRRKKGLLPYVRFPESKSIVYPVDGVREAVRQFTTPAKEDISKNNNAEIKRKKPVVSATKQKEWRI